MEPFVLVLGYRRNIARTLERLNIRFSVWVEKEVKKVNPCTQQLVTAPFPKPTVTDDHDAIRALVKGTPTHVIAATEAAVFAAAKLRRVFGALRSSETMLIRVTNKQAMKSYLSKYDVPMTDFVEHNPELTAEGLIERLQLPVVIKDLKGSGGRNTVFAHSLAEVKAAMGKGRLYERFVDAPEGSIESIIQDGQILFSSMTEYYHKKMSNVVPASYSDPIADAVHELNRQVIKALKIQWGITHLEYYRVKDGVIFGEIALRPPGGYIMDLITDAYDFDIWEAFVNVELGITVSDLPQRAKRICANFVLHPGAGTVAKVIPPTAAELPTLVRSKFKVEVGDVINSRAGVGEDVGCVFLAAENSADLYRDLDRIYQHPPVVNA